METNSDSNVKSVGRVMDKVIVGNLQDRGVQGIAVILAGTSRAKEFTN